MWVWLSESNEVISFLGTQCLMLAKHQNDILVLFKINGEDEYLFYPSYFKVCSPKTQAVNL